MYSGRASIEPPTNTWSSTNGTTESGEVRYTAFGADRYTSGTTPTSFKYTGQRQEAGIGLYYYGARWYDPALGRFTQPDTLVPDPGDAKAFDRYAYTLNNPRKYSDPTGHEVNPVCPFCNVQLLDYSNTPGWLNSTIDGLAVVSCFVAGCHADTEANTVTGPTVEEYYEQVTSSLITSGMIPLGVVKIPDKLQHELLVGGRVERCITYERISLHTNPS